MKRMPKQKPGLSKQDYATPWSFIRSVERKFGLLDWDLAATLLDKRAGKFISPEEDSLKTPWPTEGNLWLNCPFAHIAPWAKKCREHRESGATIILLTPASVGSNWFEKHVFDYALVIGLTGRITFEGETSAYPKDCMLSVFGRRPGFEIWRWEQPLDLNPPQIVTPVTVRQRRVVRRV